VHPESGLIVLLIQEVDIGTLAMPFGIDKTCSMMEKHYYYLKMTKDIDFLIKR